MCVSASQETVASVDACALQSQSWHLKESVVNRVAGYIAAAIFT